jgi:RND family efflux transporter MFP subunit
MKRSLAIIVSIITGTLLLFACGGGKNEKANPANAPVPVNLFTVYPRQVTYFDQYPGTIVALMQVDIRSEAEGFVTGIFFKEGEHVKKGQKLYTIDDKKYQANYSQAQANVRVAESNLEQAQKDADRYIYLNEHDAIAKQLLDHALTTLQVSKSQVTAAKQVLLRAHTDLDYAVIRAPFSGTIGISQVRLGNTVAIGQTTLNTISSDDPMEADFVVNEKQIPRFIKLQEQKLRPSDSIFSLIMPSNVKYPYNGSIYIIDRGVDPQTGTIKVRLMFPNPDFMLRTGMSCMVRVRNEDNEGQLLIPSKAVTEQMGEYFVFVAKDTAMAPPEAAGKNKEAPASAASLHALQKKVVLGQAVADSVIVKSGLESGDRIVVDGIQKLRDGSLITTGAAKPPQQGQGAQSK